ncbi:MAG: dienelactone hydrolase family protein [Spirochaeta sp.]
MTPNTPNSQPSDITIPVESVTLPAYLTVPADTENLVMFVHGAGSSRLSPRNTYVARMLQEAGLGTLLFDLLTQAEDRVYENRFDIELITQRLLAATKWVRQKYPSLRLQYFGASTGSAAALNAAAAGSGEIHAVVSRGGRPDLAMEMLPRVKTPTLFIVGGNDTQVKQLNEQAYAQLECEKSFEVVPGAGHLFEEEGKLEQVARLSVDWFTSHG